MSASSSTISSDAAGFPRAPALARADRRFALTVAVLVLGVLQTIAAFNIAVDPFGYFGFNQVGFFFNSEREFKQRQIHHSPHRGLLLGNSKMAYIDPALLREYEFFNAAFSAAKPEEILEFLEAHLTDEDFVALALDHRMFLTYEVHDLEVRRPHWNDWLRYSLSLELLQKSLEAVALWRRGMPSYYKTNGARSTIELQVRDYTTEGIGYWDKLDIREEEYTRIDSVFEPRRIEIFRRMKQLFDRRGIEHVVYMSPLNVHEQGVIGWQEKWLPDPDYQALVAELKSIFPEFRDYSVSRFSGPENFWPTDFKHYRPEVGAAIIREMLEDKGIRPRDAGG